ncbi:MAG: hypothetical protein NVS1B14_01760 [Vulcanimicrobiaceae bacterium]
MQLRPVPFETYARDVLPLTAALWAGGRSFDEYVAQTLELARSGYGKRSFKILGLYDGTDMVASCKRYERRIHFGASRLRALGIGAVFTPPPQRGRGYATAMLAMALDAERAQADVAYLFSDIHPAFYEQIGFRELPSRAVSVRADSLQGKPVRIGTMQDRDWSGVRACFEAGEAAREWGFLRPPLVWSFLRQRFVQRARTRAGQPVALVLRRGPDVIAYVNGERDVRRDMFVLDEFGALDAQAWAYVPSLLRGAAGDLRRIGGWLPPQGARAALPRGSVRKRKDALLMMAPLSPIGAQLIARAALPSPHDGVWSVDHV